MRNSPSRIIVIFYAIIVVIDVHCVVSSFAVAFVLFDKVGVKVVMHALFLSFGNFSLLRSRTILSLIGCVSFETIFSSSISLSLRCSVVFFVFHKFRLDSEAIASNANHRIMLEPVVIFAI